MLSAIDTNVISALWSNEPASEGINELLFAAQQAGGLVICAPVYAELMAYSGGNKAFLETFLEDTQIQVEMNLERKIWERAGEAYSAYAERRRRDRAGQPKRLLVDFVVGAHALLGTDRLLTLDPKPYRTAYPELQLLPTGNES